MARQDRRALGARGGGFRGVVLRGGPMDGYIVTQDAPALAADWWRTWPCWQGFDYPRRGQREPGRYVRDPEASLATAVWQPLPDEVPPSIRRGLLAGAWRLVRPLALVALLAWLVFALVDAAASGIALSLTIGDLFLRLFADGSELERDVEREAKAAAEKGGTAAGKTLGQRMGQAATKALTIAGGAIGTFVAGGIEQFGAFDDRMREVFSIMPGISREAAAKMTEDVKGVATEYGILTKELIPALTTAIGSGIPEENVMDFLRVAAKAAKAGAADAETSVKALSASINAFQIPVEKADQVANSFFNAIDKGVTTFPELAGSISLVAPTAAALGLSLEDVLAAVTAMTLQGTPTSSAMTNITGSLNALQRVTPPMAKALKNLGFETGQAALDALGYQGTMEALRAEADRMGVPLIKLTGRMEGASAIFQLTGDNAQRANDILGTFGDTTGKVDQAFETMEGGIGGASRRLAAQIEVLAINVGEKLAGIGPVLLALNQGGNLFGISPARIFGGVAGAITGKLIPSIVGGLKRGAGPVAATIAGFFEDIALGRRTGVAGAVNRAGAALSGLFGKAFGGALERVGGSPPVTAAANLMGTRVGTIIGKGLIVGIIAGFAIEEFLRHQAQINAIGDRLADEVAKNAVDKPLAELKARREQAQQELESNPFFGSALDIFGAKAQGERMLAELDAAIAAAEAKARQTPEAIAQGLADQRAGERVLAAAGDMVDGIPGAVADAGDEAAAEAAKTPGEISAGLRSGFDSIETALDDLRQLFHDALSPTKRIARLEAIAATKLMAKALNDNRPEVRTAAQQLAIDTIAQLATLKPDSAAIGKLTTQLLASGMTSQEIKAVLAAGGLSEAVIDELDGLKPEAKDAGKEGGDAFAGGVGSKEGAASRHAGRLRSAVREKFRLANAYTWGRTAGGNWIRGLSSVQAAAEHAASKLAGAVGNFLKVSSPSKLGPFSLGGGPGGWGLRGGSLWVGGIAAAIRHGVGELRAAVGLAGDSLTVPGAPWALASPPGGVPGLDAPAVRAPSFLPAGTTPGLTTAASTTVGGNTYHVHLTDKLEVRKPRDIVEELGRLEAVGVLPRARTTR